MYKEYIKEYKCHAHTYGPNTAIFMLVGVFYELYDIPDPLTGETQTSMKRAVELLGIQLKTKKGDAPGGADGLFAGFGEDQLHKFAALLTRENWTVVVIDQQKDSKGKVVNRPVTRILSPGTHVEASALGGDAFYLGGLYLDGDCWTEGGAAVAAVATAPSFSAVAMDLTTGSVTTYEGRAAGRREGWTSDDLLHFFQVHPPREITVWWRGHALDQPSESLLRRTLGVPSALLHCRLATDLGPSLEKDVVREDLLRRCFNVKSLLPLKDVLHLREKPLTERVLCALLLFVEDHFPSAMEHLHAPIPWNPREAVYLGNHALTQLNMITPREEDSVLGLFAKTYTQMGRRAMRQRLLFPVAVPATLERRYEEIAWWQNAAEEVREAAVGTLRQIQDLSRLHRRLGTGSVNVIDVLALDQSYGCARRLASCLVENKSPQAMPATLVDSFEEFRRAFGRVFSIEKAMEATSRPDGLQELFCLTSEAGPATEALESALAETRKQIDTLYLEIVEWFQEDTKTLRMEFKESTVLLTGGKTLMTRAQGRLKTHQSSLPTSLTGIMIQSKKASSSMEVPVLIGLYHKLLRLREELARSIRKELPPACDTLAGSYMTTLDSLERWISSVDVAATLARVASERGLCRPVLIEDEDGAVFQATGLRHPLIEAQQTRLEYVRHTVELGADAVEQGWLVYGMNASGKSSLMKAVGIAVLLAQCGSFVPATTLRLSPFSALFTRILNTDNLWAGLSSFAVEMTELKEILERADSRSLVLGDEVCSGTESESATALVAATLEHFQTRRVRYIFATHLHGLQAVEGVRRLAGLKVWHLRVRYDAAADRLIYERTLHPGAGSSLYGLEVARAMGLPTKILESAHQIRRRIAGVATEAEAPRSDWNPVLQRRVCEVCGCALVRDLEVHHIRPRAEATGGRLADGSSMNALRNLVVVCQECHDKHHAGRLEIGSMQQTSDGPRRQIVDLSAFEYRGDGSVKTTNTASVSTSLGQSTVRRTGGLSEEQMETVKELLRKYPNLPPTRMVYMAEEEYGIKLSVQRLRSLRASLPSI